MNWVLDYFRRSADHRLLFGGRVSYSGLAPFDAPEATRQRMVAVFPQLADVKLEYAWGGEVDITLNRAPDFGRLAPNVYFLQGFSGHGIALTGIAGKLVAEAIAGTAERFDVFARIPHRSFPGGTALRRPALVLAMLYYRLKDCFRASCSRARAPRLCWAARSEKLNSTRSLAAVNVRADQPGRRRCHRARDRKTDRRSPTRPSLPSRHARCHRWSAAASGTAFRDELAERGDRRHPGLPSVGIHELHAERVVRSALPSGSSDEAPRATRSARKRSASPRAPRSAPTHGPQRLRIGARVAAAGTAPRDEPSPCEATPRAGKHGIARSMKLASSAVTSGTSSPSSHTIGRSVSLP